LEIPDALKLLERLDLKGKIVTGDAIFCQKTDPGENRRKRWRLCLSNQRQSEDIVRECRSDDFADLPGLDELGAALIEILDELEAGAEDREDDELGGDKALPLFAHAGIPP
jgi:predicted transposase YbfD/YdcC